MAPHGMLRACTQRTRPFPPSTWAAAPVAAGAWPCARRMRFRCMRTATRLGQASTRRSTTRRTALAARCVRCAARLMRYGWCAVQPHMRQLRRMHRERALACAFGRWGMWTALSFPYVRPHDMRNGASRGNTRTAQLRFVQGSRCAQTPSSRAWTRWMRPRAAPSVATVGNRPGAALHPDGCAAAPSPYGGQRGFLQKHPPGR